MAKSKIVIADMSNVGGGTNTDDDMIKIKKDQVQASLNAKLFKNGVFRRPGTEAGDAVLTTNARGMFIYRQLDGTETKLLVSNGKLYSTPSNLDSITELYDMTGSGQAYFANSLDKCFVCNGTEVVKVEGTNCYQVGISPPSGVSAEEAAGGTIPDGTYTVYACYARLIGGSNVLYSVGENVGNVVLSGGNNTIAITNFGNSSDAQVGNKVIFLTEPDGTTPFYHETGDNTTTSFNITSTANKNELIAYGTVASENTRPTAFEYIFAFDGSIYGSEGNTLYRGIKNTSNAYDSERFVSSLVLPYAIKGIFSLAEHLYLNTTGGIIRIPNGNINYQWEKITDDYFFHINTVVEIPNSGILGLTFQNMRIFNGEKFLNYDISQDIRPDIKKIYTSSSGFYPFGILVREKNRLAYHISFNDDSLSSTSNNTTWVLNIDKLQFLPNADVVAPWEKWSNGFNYACVDKSQVIYLLQDHTTPILYKYNENNTIDNGIYLSNGSLGTSESATTISITYRGIMISPYIRQRWTLARLVAKAIYAIQSVLYIREGPTDIADSENISGDLGGDVWAPASENEFVWDESEWGSDKLVFTSAKFGDHIKGYIVYVNVSQTADDVNFHILNLQIQGDSTHDRSTEMA